MNHIKIIFTIFALTMSSLSQANLISNGGFESPDIGGGWTYLQDSADGWQGDNIEVWQTGFLGVNSYEGSQHGELNAHPYDATSWSIYQTFDTVKDASYDLSFAYRARKSSNEAFNMSLFTGDVSDNNSFDFSNGFDLIFDEHTTASWSTFSNSFIGTGEATTLMFTSINPDVGTVGNFLDAVVVDGPVSVPEPSSLALLAFAVMGFGISRRKIRKE